MDELCIVIHIVPNVQFLDSFRFEQFQIRFMKGSIGILAGQLRCADLFQLLIVRRSVYPGATFKVNADSLTGTEMLTLPNGDKLTIRNWGCEYYVLTFRFETNQFEADTTNMRYWLDKATVLMDGIGNGLDAPLNLEQGTIVTKELVQAGRQYHLGEEIEYDSSEIRGFVTLDRVQRLSDKRYAVEISYALGPL